MSLYDFIMIIAASAVAYMIGSFNTSIVLSQLFMKKDIRDLGSGNAGTTNMLRSGSKSLAIATLLIDAAKAVFCVVGARLLLMYTSDIQNNLAIEIIPILAGFFCMVGHIYPMYFNFRGGKGVAIMAAMIAAIDYRAFLCCLGIFIISVAITRYVSLGSVLGAICLPISSFCFAFFIDFLLLKSVSISYIIVFTSAMILASALIIFKHRSNIKRLINGTENKLFSKKAKA